MTWWQYVWTCMWMPGDRYTRQAWREAYEQQRDLRRQVKRDRRQQKRER